jgi:transglutaminase-like putative cysteine protease
VNTDLQLDRALARWLAEGAERFPADDLAAALGQVDRTRQRRSLAAHRGPHAGRGLAARFSLGVVVVLLALSAAWTAIPRVPQNAGSASIHTLDVRWAGAAAAPAVVAFTATLPAAAPQQIYWRAAAYDTFDLGAWSQSVDSTVSVPAGGSLLRGSAEVPPDPSTVPIRATIRPGAFRDGLLIAPGTPVRVNADASVRTVGADAWLAAVDVPAVAAYTVEARLLRIDGNEALSPGRLRAAGSVYPRDIEERYTAVPAGALGPDARAMLAAILASTPSRDPYDLAVAIEAYLQDPRFRYDVTPPPCADPSIVECFARTRAGFCLQYASTMAILLRSAIPDSPVPTRIVQGFLPGERSGTVETVSSLLAHAWVEVYFEGVGWVPFDPTGGAIGRPTVISEDVSPIGSAVP